MTKRIFQSFVALAATLTATTAWAGNKYWQEKNTSDVTAANWYGGIGTWSSDVYFVTEPDFTGGKWTVSTLDFSKIGPETTINKLCISNGIEDDRVVTLKGGAKFAYLYAGYYADYAFYSGRFILDGDYTTGYLELGPWYGQAYAITGMVTVATSSTLEVTGDAKLGTSTKGVGILEVNGDMTIGGTITAGYAAGGKGFVVVDGGTLDVTNELQLADNDDTEAKMTITNATVTASSWVCIGRNGARRTAVCTVDNGGYILHTVDDTKTGLFCIGNLGGDDSHNELIVNEGGRVHTYGDVRVGEAGSAILTMNGGTFRAATESGGQRWIIMNSKNSAYDTTINLNDGVIECGRITTGGSGIGAATLVFNGGTLRALATDTLISDHTDLTVTVAENGGTIDANGYDVTIEEAIGGEGTLTITGGGTITFEAVPTCPVFIEEGVVVCTSTTTPAHIAFGKNGFLKYDLSSITENPYTLASNMDDIGLPEGDVLKEHVIILNGDTSLNGDTRWTVYQEDTDLFAVISEDSSTTIWTGAHSDKWLLYPKNWTNGRPTLDSKMIVPYASQVNLGGQSLECGSVEIRTTEELNIYANPADNNHIWLTSVTGSGTLRTNCPWIETSTNAGCNIDVPLTVLANNYGSHFKSWNGNNLNINNTLMIPYGVTTSVEGGNYVHINGDLVVNGTWIYPTAIAAGKTLSGSGTLAGSLELNGIVAPGTNTAETLTVTGAATFNAGSSLLVTIGENRTSSCLALTGAGTVDVSNISVDVANKSALVRNSGYEYTVMTAESGSIVGKVAGAVTADDGSVWKAFVSEDGKSLVLREERRSGLLIMFK